MGMGGITIFTGSAHPELAEEICHHLDTPISPTNIMRFSNDCLQVQLQANCRQEDVFIVQPLVPPVQEHVMELMLMLDAARGASAARITAVMPFYGYSRQDKKVLPREPISARLMGDLFMAAGADRLRGRRATGRRARTSATAARCRETAPPS